MLFKGFASSYNAELLNSFKPEIQLKDTESVVKSKLIDLLTELRGLKLILVNISFSGLRVNHSESAFQSESTLYSCLNV